MFTKALSSDLEFEMDKFGAFVSQSDVATDPDGTASGGPYQRYDVDNPTIATGQQQPTTGTNQISQGHADNTHGTTEASDRQLHGQPTRSMDCWLVEV